MRTDRLELRLTADLASKLDAVARHMKANRSDVVRQLVLREYAAVVASPVAPVLKPLMKAPSGLDIHERLWGAPPSGIQRRLYEAYGRGYRAATPTEEQIDAVLTMLAAIGHQRPVGRVDIIAPTSLWVLVTKRFKAMKAGVLESGLDACVTEVLRRMNPTDVDRLPAREPGVWGAIGVDPTSAPAWLKKRLVEAG